jgi:hypothetical protein
MHMETTVLQVFIIDEFGPDDTITSTTYPRHNMKDVNTYCLDIQWMGLHVTCLFM